MKKLLTYVKLIIKRIFLGLGIILTLPLIILTWTEIIIKGKKAARIYSQCKQTLSICPTIFGDYLRLAYYWAVCTKISPDVQLMLGSIISHRDTIIRAGSGVGLYSTIGYADIGENVLIGSRVSILSGKYQHGRPSERAKNLETSGEFTTVRIGDNTWIGDGALILANIGKNCTVGAGCVVFKDIPDGTTVLGNPARKVNI